MARSRPLASRGSSVVPPIRREARPATRRGKRKGRRPGQFSRWPPALPRQAASAGHPECPYPPQGCEVAC
eukprot:15457153-Alexandrium_andersonii.AAC.1